MVMVRIRTKRRRYVKEVLIRPNGKLIATNRTVGQNMWVTDCDNKVMLEERLKWTPATLDLFKNVMDKLCRARPIQKVDIVIENDALTVQTNISMSLNTTGMNRISKIFGLTSDQCVYVADAKPTREIRTWKLLNLLSSTITVTLKLLKYLSVHRNRNTTDWIPRRES